MAPAADRARLDTLGKTGATGSSMDTSCAMNELHEHERRKPGASGSPVKLADGRPWLLAIPTFRPDVEGLTRPRVDQPLDRIFASAVLDEDLSLKDVWEAARSLLKHNYDISDEEIATLIGVFTEAEGRSLAKEILGILFGTERRERTFTHWVRASLIANGLTDAEISSEDLMDVLAVLVSTNRTISLTKFIDACRLADERARLEALI